VIFVLILCKCGVHVFMYEEHGGSMVVARFTNCSYGEGLVCSLILEFEKLLVGLFGLEP